jgi:hypothetical protein
MDAKRRFFDLLLGPDAIEELVLADELSRSFGKSDQNFHGARADLHRLTISQQRPLSGEQLKGRGRQPVAWVEMFHRVILGSPYLRGSAQADPYNVGDEAR